MPQILFELSSKNVRGGPESGKEDVL